MLSAFGFFYFLFGTIIGSFLNVVISRHNTGIRLRGRSSCATCARPLRPFELIPIVSYLALRGRCRTCGSHISTQYPLVELSTGLLFLGIFLMDLVPVEELFLAIAVSLLVIIFVYDTYHKIIPNTFVYAFSVLAFLLLFIDLETITFLVPSSGDLLAGPLLFTPFFLLWFVSSGKWMGLGDAKLSLGIGWFLGITQGISAIMIAFWLGALVSVFLIVMPKVFRLTRLFSHSKSYTMKSEVPFAPFLIAGFLISLFFDIHVFSAFFSGWNFI